jgi:hypothetical protein
MRMFFKILIAVAMTVATLAMATAPSSAGNGYRSGKHNVVKGKHHGY